MAAVGRLNAAIRDLAPLEQMQQEAANVFEALVRAASATTPAALETIRKDVDQSVRHIDDLVSGLDPDLSLELIVPISKLRTNAVSQSGVIAARQAELKAIQEGRRLTVENSDLSAQLSSKLQRFLGSSRVKIDPTMTGIDNTAQARLTFEQQVSKDVTMTYITNLNYTAEQIVRVQWDLTPTWSAIAVRDANGLFGIDFQYRRRF